MPDKASESRQQKVTGRIHRLLRLITVLQSGQDSGAAHLMRQLGVSRRTLYRDLNLLQTAGIPCYHKRGVGYRIARTFFLPPVNLTIPETLGLMLLGKTAQAQRDRPLAASAVAAINKLNATMPEAIREVCQEILHHVSVQPAPQADGNVETMHYSTLVRCIDEARWCELRYQSPVQAQPIVTPIKPYALHFASRAWYLFAWAQAFDEVRVFKLARIATLDPMQKHFTRPNGFKPSDKLGKAWQLIPEGKVYRVELEFSPKVGTNVFEVRWHESQQAKLLPDGRCRMHFEVDGLGEIAWWLCGYADQVTVLKPAPLRKRVAEMMRSAARHHGGNL